MDASVVQRAELAFGDDDDEEQQGTASELLKKAAAILAGVATEKDEILLELRRLGAQPNRVGTSRAGYAIGTRATRTSMQRLHGESLHGWAIGGVKEKASRRNPCGSTDIRPHHRAEKIHTACGTMMRASNAGTDGS